MLIWDRKILFLLIAIFYNKRTLISALSSVTTCKVDNWKKTVVEGLLSPNSASPFDVVELRVNENDVKVELNLFLKLKR